MRSLHALTNAMRKRRTRRIDLDEADRLAAGDRPGPHHPGLGILLDTLRAPGTPGELAGEKATVAAFTAHRKRAARATRRRHRTRTTPTRALVTTLMTALALLLFGGTALAARTGHLPDDAQQRAHHLFSALGVPAPRTGPHHPSPSSSPSAAPTPPAVELGWCAEWQPGGPSLSSENHQRLRTAAGSEQRIPGYCDRLRHSAAPPIPSGSVTPRSTPPPTSSTPTSEPTGSAPRTTPAHPTPADATPSHHQPTPGGPAKKAGPKVTPR
jgi:hypothetical protein